jgi:hypothetical protein
LFGFDVPSQTEPPCQVVAEAGPRGFYCRFSVDTSGSIGEHLVEQFAGNIVARVFTPVLAKHSKSFNLIDTLVVGVDRIQRNFEPMQRQVEQWRSSQITDERAKLILYEAFVDGELEAPRSLLPEVHRLYFEPQYPEFSALTMWSLSNAFTSAFKKLDPIPQFKATAKLGEFLSQLPA